MREGKEEGLDAMSEARKAGRRGESGFALILAILALLLLTTMGLTLSSTTSTELQIASNYRWSQQAFYNAEAGLAVAKHYLPNEDWKRVVPADRAGTILPIPTNAGCYGGTLPLTPPYPGCPPTANATWTASLRPGPNGVPNRSWEAKECDPQWFEGYGWVLDIPGLAFPLQDVSSFLGQALNGTFTIWVRRPLTMLPDASQEDDHWTTGLQTVLVTVEGTAPYANVAGGALLGSSALGIRNRAVRYVEAQLQLNVGSGCDENRRSQVGTGPLGANFDPCTSVGFAGIGAGATSELTGVK